MFFLIALRKHLTKATSERFVWAHSLRETICDGNPLGQLVTLVTLNPQSGSRKACILPGVQLALFFILSRIPAHAMVLPIFRLGLPT